VIRIILTAALLPFLLGCGLSAYEAKMTAAQHRADDFDRKENVLGGMIETPPACPIDVKLRAPGGISSKPDTARESDFFYRFRRRSGEKGQGLYEVLLGAAVSGAEARQKVQQEFPAATPLPARAFEGSGQEPLSFDAWVEGEANARTYIYLHQRAGMGVVVAFRTSKTDDDLESAITASLKTLTATVRPPAQD
jgi:hypothetical protein